MIKSGGCTGYLAQLSGICQGRLVRCSAVQCGTQRRFALPSSSHSHLCIQCTSGLHAILLHLAPWRQIRRSSASLSLK